jgi:hypothetical protein
MKRFVVATCGVFLVLGTNAIAQQPKNCAGPHLGTWKLQSYTREDLATGQKTDLFGARPSGYISYGSDCRMYAILIKEGRKAPAGLVPTDAERIELYAGLIAYAGAYTIDGDKISHHIDASWNQACTGTTQVRQFKIEGKTLHIRTMPAGSVLVWNKVE